MVDFKELSAKNKNQELAKDAIRKVGYNATIISTVGSGKAKILIDLADELIRLGKVKTILYLCNSSRLRDKDFPDEVEKWGSPELIKRIRYECYQTAYKWENVEYDLLLADEFDFAITKEYIKTFLNNKFKYKILVSGTLTSEKKAVVSKIAPVVFKLDTNSAERQGIVNKTNYFVYNFKMDNDEVRVYNSYTKKIRLLIAAGTDFNDDDMVLWLRKRKLFLNKLDSSYRACRKVMQYFYNQNKSNRMIIFCELKEQADRVCKYSYHGGNAQDDNLEQFQKGEIDALSVVSKIERGTNLKNCNIGIFESLSGSSTKLQQRNGRLKRLGVDEIATVVFLIPWTFKPVREEDEVSYEWCPTIVRDWVDKATKGLNINFKTLKV